MLLRCIRTVRLGMRSAHLDAYPPRSRFGKRPFFVRLTCRFSVHENRTGGGTASKRVRNNVIKASAER